MSSQHLGIQIVLISFAAFALLRAVQRFRKGGLSILQFLLWSVFWVGLAVAALMPNVTAKIAAFFGVGRGVDLAIYLSLALLFYVAFRQLAKIEDLERQITRMVRAHALREFEQGVSGQLDRKPAPAPPSPPVPPPPPRSPA